MVAAVVLATVATFLYGTLAGWVVHWILHQRWAGRFHRAHLNHHLKQYPPHNLVSDTYRSAGKDDSTVLFAPPITVSFAAFLGTLWALGLPTWSLGLLLVEGALISFLTDYIHDQFHLRAPWLVRFAWFRNLRSLHWIHHVNMRRNLGIMWLGWDRVFRTFRRRAGSGRFG